MQSKLSELFHINNVLCFKEKLPFKVNLENNLFEDDGILEMKKLQLIYDYKKKTVVLSIKGCRMQK